MKDILEGSLKSERNPDGLLTGDIRQYYWRNQPVIAFINEACMKTEQVCIKRIDDLEYGIPKDLFGQVALKILAPFGEIDQILCQVALGSNHLTHTEKYKDKINELQAKIEQQQMDVAKLVLNDRLTRQVQELKDNYFGFHCFHAQLKQGTE